MSTVPEDRGQVSNADTVGETSRIPRKSAGGGEAVDVTGVSTHLASGVHHASWHTYVARGAKALVGIGLVLLLGWAPAARLMENASGEAIVNAHLVTLRAPIDGEIQTTAVESELTAPVSEGTALFVVSNPRADSSAVTALRQKLSQLDAQAAADEVQAKSMREQHQELQRKTEAFRLGRIAQLEARINSRVADIAGAQTRLNFAELAFQRVKALAEMKASSAASLEAVERDYAMAGQGLASLRHLLSEAKVELITLQDGVFLGDDYNDQPSSMQRAEQLRTDLASLDAHQARTSLERSATKLRLAEEEDRYNQLRQAVLSAPANGRPWQVFVSDAEMVRKDQELLRFHTCANTVVTANVSESVYNTLNVGDRAHFRLKGQSRELPGHIQQLFGSSQAASNLAIEPRGLEKAPYHVVVLVPDLRDKQDNCAIGRTGRVVFLGAATSATQIAKSQ